VKRQLEQTVEALATRLRSLGDEAPASVGPGTVAVRVVGREQGGKAVLPLPRVRVRFGWKRKQVEALTDVEGWAVARLPVGVEQGAYRVSLLKESGKVLASKRGTVSPGARQAVQDFEVKASPALRESFERGRQWRDAVTQAALQVSESLQGGSLGEPEQSRSGS
jgi:hypothetical protein